MKYGNSLFGVVLIIRKTEHLLKMFITFSDFLFCALSIYSLSIFLLNYLTFLTGCKELFILNIDFFVEYVATILSQSFACKRQV